MNDLELCKRIAEIEGLTPVVIGNVKCADNVYVVRGSGYGSGRSESPYNPLTNKALLFDLMAKHDVTVDFFSGEVLVACGESSWFSDNDEAPRLILTAIVEANTQ